MVTRPLVGVGAVRHIVAFSRRDIAERLAVVTVLDHLADGSAPAVGSDGALSWVGLPAGAGPSGRPRSPGAWGGAGGAAGQADLIAETSNSRVIFSLTRTPPVSSAAFQVMP